MSIDIILDKLLEDIVDANFNGYNYALYKPAKEALYSLLMDVIGVNEQPHDIRLMDTNTAIFLNNKIAFCNGLRAEQRQKLNKLFNKETDK